MMWKNVFIRVYVSSLLPALRLPPVFPAEPVSVCRSAEPGPLGRLGPVSCQRLQAVLLCGACLCWADNMGVGLWSIISMHKHALQTAMLQTPEVTRMV